MIGGMEKKEKLVNAKLTVSVADYGLEKAAHTVLTFFSPGLAWDKKLSESGRGHQLVSIQEYFCFSVHSLCVEAEVTSVCRMSSCFFVLQLELTIMYIKVCLTALLNSNAILFMVCIPAVVFFLNYNESCT